MTESLETALVRYLEANPGVNALVAGRIYPLQLPERVTLPAIRYQRVSTSPVVAHTGFSELERARVQLSVHAATYEEAAGVVRALRRALDGKGELFGTGTSCFVINDVADFEEASGQYVRHVDIEPWHHDSLD